MRPLSSKFLFVKIGEKKLFYVDWELVIPSWRTLIYYLVNHDAPATSVALNSESLTYSSSVLDFLHFVVSSIFQAPSLELLQATNLFSISPHSSAKRDSFLCSETTKPCVSNYVVVHSAAQRKKWFFLCFGDFFCW